MTDAQLYLGIGLPILANATLITLLLAHVNARFSSMDRRFDDMRDLWCAELHRVEEVLNARLGYIEENCR